MGSVTPPQQDRPSSWLARGLILAARSYQLLLSPLLGRNCRFHPTCSQYFIAAVTRYGALAGAWKGLNRIRRCHPWNPGGYDPP
ncbi:MAG: membrane protein insertion efficiency factor YidD [Planctomycetaceae bacterium]